MAVSSTTRTYAGASAQERSERRRQALIDAALAVSESGGWRQVTVDRVRQLAGLSKRYFYESFSDLDALADAVVEHVARGAIDAVSITRPDGANVPQFAHATIDALVRYLTDDPRRARVLFGELAISEAGANHRAAAIRGIAAQVVAVAREIHHAPKVTDPIIQTTAALLIGGTGQAILSWLDGEIPGSRNVLIDNLTTLWLITGDGVAAHARNRTTTRRPTTSPARRKPNR
jgi:AcrR family transcriptional regulator